MQHAGTSMSWNSLLTFKNQGDTEVTPGRTAGIHSKWSDCTLPHAHWFKATQDSTHLLRNMNNCEGKTVWMGGREGAV